jgi:hypothetical protein
MSTWISTAPLCERLGCSRSTLHDYRAAGIFRPGEHYRRVGIGRTGPLQWQPEACEATMAAHTRQAEGQGVA